jgi:hypothetical protein
MAEQATVTLFDWAAAQTARDAAVTSVGENASATWMMRARQAIDWCAATTDEFTTDDVWQAMEGIPGPHDGRAMGAAMTNARRAGVIVPTDRFRNSIQVSNHGRPVRLWRGVGR